MNILDILILLAVGAAVVFAIRGMRRRKGGCGCGCEGCKGCSGKR